MPGDATGSSLATGVDDEGRLWAQVGDKAYLSILQLRLRAGLGPLRPGLCAGKLCRILSDGLWPARSIAGAGSVPRRVWRRGQWARPPGQTPMRAALLVTSQTATVRKRIAAVSLTWRRLHDRHGLGLCLRLVPTPPTLSATNLNIAGGEQTAMLLLACARAMPDKDDPLIRGTGHAGRARCYARLMGSRHQLLTSEQRRQS